MNYETFLLHREQMRFVRPDLLDLSELNVYRSLSFPPIAPSTQAEAPYRCHFAERFLSHLGLSQTLKARAQVSHGVRRSLRALFGFLASRQARVGIPDDVYPVYLQLAAEAGMSVVPFASRLGLPALGSLDALLLCEPLKPWGTSLTDDEADELTSWVRADPRRCLMLDSAYATPPTPVALRLLEADVAIVLVSLSKAWLLPDHGGLCIVPTSLKVDVRPVFAELPKDESKIRTAYAALTEYQHRPTEVALHLAERARRLDAITESLPSLKATRCVSYFATCRLSLEELLAMGVLAAPSSVFGGPCDISILSSLRPCGVPRPAP